MSEIVSYCDDWWTRVLGLRDYALSAFVVGLCAWVGRSLLAQDVKLVSKVEMWL